MRGVVAGVALLAAHTTGAVAPPPNYAADPIDASSLLVAGTALDIESMHSGNVMRRIAALRSGARGLDFTGLNVQAGERRIGGDSLNAVSQPIFGPMFDGMLNRGDLGRWGAFANGDVRRNSAASIGGATADNSIGMTTGVDYRLHDHLAVGSSIGYANYGIDAAARSTLLDVRSRRVSLFGTYFRPDLMHIDGLIAYGSNAYDSTRRVDTGALPSVAKGATDGNQLSAALTSALDLRNGPWRLAPKLGAYLLSVGVNPIDEYGAGNRDLAVGDQRAQSLRLSAGARLSVALRTPLGVVTPSVNADYVHDDDRAKPTDARLRTATDDRAVTSTDAALGQLDPGYFVWSLGASAQVAKALSGFVNYRSPANTDSGASSELTWGVRFETSLR